MKIKVGIQGQALYSLAYKRTDFFRKSLILNICLSSEVSFRLYTLLFGKVDTNFL